jgi:hypothetical protein
VEEDPAGVDHGRGSALLAWMEGGDEAEKKADGKDEDAEGDGFISPVDEEEGESEEETEEGLGLVGVDRQTMVGGVEHLGERDEVEEDGSDGGRDGDVTPAGTVVEGSRQNRERGYAVEEDRDSEPEEGHDHRSPAVKLANLQYIGLCRERIAWVPGSIFMPLCLCERDYDSTGDDQGSACHDHCRGGLFEYKPRDELSDDKEKDDV